MFMNEGIKIFSGSSNPVLTSAVCKYLGIPIGGAEIDRFPDGEKFIRVEDDVRGTDCFVVQSTCKPVDEHLVAGNIRVPVQRAPSDSNAEPVLRVARPPVDVASWRVTIAACACTSTPSVPIKSQLTPIISAASLTPFFTGSKNLVLTTHVMKANRRGLSGF